MIMYINNFSKTHFVYYTILYLLNTNVFLDRATSTIDILPALILFAEALLSLIVYCCNNRAVFRICVGSLMVINLYVYLKYSVLIYILLLAILATSTKFTSSDYG